MEIKKIEFSGKTLEYFEAPNGETRFVTDSLFKILEQPKPMELDGLELHFLEYGIALHYADTHNEKLAAFIRDNFQEGELGSLIEGQ